MQVLDVRESSEVADRIEDSNVEITEIHCHNCDGYIKFPLDKSKSGRHVLNCPKCSHEHCRVVKDGKVTDERWDSRNADQWGSQSSFTPTYTYTLTMNSYSTTGAQVYTANSGSPQMQSSWMNTQDVYDYVYTTVTAL